MVPRGMAEVATAFDGPVRSKLLAFGVNRFGGFPLRFVCDSLPVGGALSENHYHLIFVRVSRARLQPGIRGGLRGGLSGLVRARSFA